MGQIGKGLEYVKSILCILKIVEIIVLLIAFALAGHFLNEIDDGYFDIFGKKGNISFFIFATVVGWIIAIVFAIIFIVGIHEKISALPWPLVVAIVSAVWTLLLLISSALLAVAAQHFDDEKFHGHTACYWLDNNNNETADCGQLVGGTVLGFIATVLFAVDTVIHARMFLTQGSAPQASAVATPTV